MTTRIAPYAHSDGSSCWTKNCSRGNSKTDTNEVTLLNKRLKELLARPQAQAVITKHDSVKNNELYYSVLCDTNEHAACNSERCDCTCHKKINAKVSNERDLISRLGYELVTSKQEVGDPAFIVKLAAAHYNVELSDRKMPEALVYAVKQHSTKGYWSLREFEEDIDTFLGKTALT